MNSEQYNQSKRILVFAGELNKVEQHQIKIFKGTDNTNFIVGLMLKM